MRTALLLAVSMLTGMLTHAADEIEPLDADFLDYLANLEADDDNWTLLDDPDREPASQDSEKEPAKPAARKANKEAAKPAVEER
ncbi:hypothetical protein [Peristeroidobacter agariperforans]|uniref:hypothetical protein n=1 Tax=Peristeroidobacter agariperforans TaxID=268404 RepID=UPI00101BD4A8|nr:hypothetical protein [Peristeroidobacter agariperforans]